MTDINDTIFEVLADINSCSSWLDCLYLCNPDGTEISDEDRNDLKKGKKSRYGGGLCIEEIWMEGLKKGFSLKAVPQEDEPVCVTYQKLAKACAGVDIDSSWFDGLTVDRVFQTACFNEVVYG